MERLAAVTGGTGFFGRYCVAALIADGWRVRMLARRDPAHCLLAGATVELVLGDLLDAACLSRLVSGASVVVHAAGATKAVGAEAFRTTNVQGTARLAAAVARAAPGCRFVHISSQAARHPSLSPYAASKRDSEDAVAVGLGQTEWVILRPGIIYGPWDPATEALMRLAAGKLVPVPSRPEPRLAMIHARDAAEAVAAFCRPGPSRRIFELCDAALGGYAWREIVHAAREGGAPLFVTIPDWLIMASGAASDVWSAATGRAVLFGQGKAREILQRDWRPDPALRVPEGVWRPAISLYEGMGETRNWLASQAFASR